MTDPEKDVLDRIEERAEKTGKVVQRIVNVGIGIAMTVVAAMASVITMMG